MSEITKKQKVKNFLKKLGLGLLKLFVSLCIAVYRLLKFIGAKTLALCKKVLAKIRKALKEKKCGRPLVVEQPFYALKEGSKSFYKGAKEGILAYKLKRDLFADCDLPKDETVEEA